MPEPRHRASLAAALGVGRSGVHAFVGAGGKTSAIRRLLGERPRALATTTTHLGRAGFGVGMLAAAPAASALHELAARLPGVRPLTLAGTDAGARLTAPSLAWQHEFYRQHAHELICVEADGARRRRIKLPAGHEPAWPPVQLTSAIVVVGAGALGEPLADAAHRPAAFAPARWRTARVTEHHLATMVTRYLHRLPPCTPAVVLITGVDSPEAPIARRLARQSIAALRARDARHLDPSVPLRVVVTPDVTRGPFWSWQWPATLTRRVHRLPGVCGVLLAAGSGTRYGQRARLASKLLEKWRGQPLVVHALRAWDGAGFAGRIVVTGHAHRDIETVVRAEVRRRAPAPRLHIIHNRAHARGLGTSVRLAARHAPPGMGLIFVHADMPALRPATLRLIAALGSTLRDCIVVPTVGGEPVNPVYFPAALRGALARVPAARGGKAVIDTHRERVLHLAVDACGAEFRDVDRPADLQRLQVPGTRTRRRRTRPAGGRRGDR